MKTIDDLKLEDRITDMIRGLIDDVAIDLVSMSRSDYDAILQAAAMKVISEVKESK